MNKPSIRIIALSALICAYPILPLDGHAILRSSMPASNEIVHGMTVHVRLQFSSRIDGKRSRLVLSLPGGAERQLEVDQSTPDSVRADVSQLAPGRYILLWQVLAEDGHITRGALPFRTQ
jgi:copper resistance protein C